MSQERRNPAFPRMISDYLRRRAAPVLPPRAVETLREHLLDLLDRGEPLPTRGKGIDWRTLALDCGLEEELLHSARFLPQDKAAIAAEILNRAWA